jgi:hypothetical protein
MRFAGGKFGTRFAVAAILADGARRLPFWQWLIFLLHLEHKHASKPAGRYSPSVAIPNPIGQTLTLRGMIAVYMKCIRIIHHGNLQTFIFQFANHFMNVHGFSFT